MFKKIKNSTTLEALKFQIHLWPNPSPSLFNNSLKQPTFSLIVNQRLSRCPSSFFRWLGRLKRTKTNNPGCFKPSTHKIHEKGSNHIPLLLSNLNLELWIWVR